MFFTLFAATEEICKKGTKKAQFVLKPWNDNQQPGQRRSSDRILIVCAINVALLGYPKMDGLELKTLLKWMIWGYQSCEMMTLHCLPSKEEVGVWVVRPSDLSWVQCAYVHHFSARKDGVFFLKQCCNIYQHIPVC